MFSSVLTTAGSKAEQKPGESQATMAALRKSGLQALIEECGGDFSEVSEGIKEITVVLLRDLYQTSIISGFDFWKGYIEGFNLNKSSELKLLIMISKMDRKQARKYDFANVKREDDEGFIIIAEDEKDDDDKKNKAEMEADKDKHTDAKDERMWHA